MVYVFEQVVNEGTNDEITETKVFKTLRGATNYGCRVFKSHGYYAHNEHVRDYHGRNVKHIVAIWRDSQRRIIGSVAKYTG